MCLHCYLVRFFHRELFNHLDINYNTADDYEKYITTHTTHTRAHTGVPMTAIWDCKKPKLGTPDHPPTLVSNPNYGGAGAKTLSTLDYIYMEHPNITLVVGLAFDREDSYSSSERGRRLL